MDPQESQDECSRLLKRRTDHHGNGGVGLLMGSKLAQSDTVDRLSRRSRGLAIGIFVCVLGLFTAGGFAGAKMWDGHGSKDLALEMALEAAHEMENRDVRRNGATKVFSTLR